MRNFFRLENPWLHISILMILMVAVFAGTTIHLLDDGFYYQAFMQRLGGQGIIDLTIPGFHATSMFAAIIYAVTHSDYSQVYFELAVTVLTLPMIYLAVNEFYQDKKSGVLAAYIYALMPLIFITGFRGWSWPSVTFISFVVIYLVQKKSPWSIFWFGIGIIDKPFIFGLFPLFIWKKMYRQLAISLIIPIAYIITQIIQNGSIIIGVHPGLTAGHLFNLKHFLVNVGAVVQSYFSIHNYTPFNTTYVGDMIHVSPFITFFALLAVLHNAELFHDRKKYQALLWTVIIGILIPLSFFYYDRYYYTLFEIPMIILALPIIKKYKVLWPIIVASFSYQFIYTYFAYHLIFWPSGTTLPMIIMPVVIFVISCAAVVRDRKKGLLMHG